MTIGPITTIIHTVAQHYGISVEDLTGRCNARRFARPRQMVGLLARELTDKSYGEIGQRIKRHHSTIMHGERLIRDLIAADKTVAEHYDALRAKCANALHSGRIAA